MITELWESDPFTERKQALIDTLESEYHWSKGDTLVVTREGGRQRYRILHVQVEIGEKGLRREILALRI